MQTYTTKTYTKDTRRDEIQDIEQLPDVPNSIYIAAIASASGVAQPPSDPDLLSKIKNRGSGGLARFGWAPGKLQAQIPAAEREADRLSSGVAAIASAGGMSTPEAVRTEMGSRLGADLSGVQFHTDSAAESYADSIGARAYTTGSDIYFGTGGFDPAVAAHELVHTAQQGAVQAAAPVTAAPSGGVQMIPKWLKSIFGKKKKTEPTGTNEFTPVDNLPLATGTGSVNNTVENTVDPVDNTTGPDNNAPTETPAEAYDNKIDNSEGAQIDKDIIKKEKYFIPSGMGDANPRGEMYGTGKKEHRETATMVDENGAIIRDEKGKEKQKDITSSTPRSRKKVGVFRGMDTENADQKLGLTDTFKGLYGKDSGDPSADPGKAIAPNITMKVKATVPPYDYNQLQVNRKKKGFKHAFTNLVKKNSGNKSLSAKNKNDRTKRSAILDMAAKIIPTWSETGNVQLNRKQLKYFYERGYKKQKADDGQTVTGTGLDAPSSGEVNLAAIPEPLREKLDEQFAAMSKGDPGHTWVEFNTKFAEGGENRATFTMGYWPQSQVGGPTDTTPGLVMNPDPHEWDTADRVQTKDITKDKYVKALDQVVNFNETKYSFTGENCTTFALKVAKEAGMTINDDKQKIMFKSVNSPSQFGMANEENFDKETKTVGGMEQQVNKSEFMSARVISGTTKRYFIEEAIDSLDETEQGKKWEEYVDKVGEGAQADFDDRISEIRQYLNEKMEDINYVRDIMRNPKELGREAAGRLPMPPDTYLDLWGDDERIDIYVKAIVSSLCGSDTYKAWEAYADKYGDAGQKLFDIELARVSGKIREYFEDIADITEYIEGKLDLEDKADDIFKEPPKLNTKPKLPKSNKNTQEKPVEEKKTGDVKTGGNKTEDRDDVQKRLDDLLDLFN